MFGSTAEADGVLDAVDRMHQRVNGSLPESAGPYPAGTRYDAFDPRLMLWTVAVMMDSAERFYDLLVRRLRDQERESLWQDYIRFGELFRMPRDAVPQTYAGFRGYYAEILSGDEVWLTEEARRVGQFTAFEIPMRGYMQPAKRLHDLIMLGSLPPQVRRIYRLPWTPAHALAFDVVTRAFRLAHPALPAQLARGSNTSVFDGVADVEAWRLATGRPTPQVGV
jgi:uncharacterized protein (DUF2236 family)